VQVDFKGEQTLLPSREKREGENITGISKIVSKEVICFLKPIMVKSVALAGKVGSR